jgi:tetratricopeptide (TPR) repeat protein
LKRVDKAITAYERAIKINPKHNKAWANKGKALMELGKSKWKEAMSCYDISIGIDSKNVYPWINKCHLLIKMRRFPDALKTADKALELGHVDSMIWHNKAHAFFKMQNWKKAVECYNEELELNPASSRGLYFRACCNAAIGSREEMFSDLIKCKSLGGESYLDHAVTEIHFEPYRNDSEFKLILNS